MRIFDTFPFDGELDVLEHRLRETYDLVDAFVLVEAAQTYSGRAKELTFAEHRERFAWAGAKLRHVRLDRLGGEERSARERAAIQRDAVRLGLRDAAPDDVVLLFDVDEIPSPALLRQLREHGVDQPRRVLMTRHYQHPDVVAPRSPCCPSDAVAFQTATPHLRPGRWDALDARWLSASGVAVPYSALASRSAFDLRFGEIDAAPLPDGGRHFSSVDPSTHLDRKLHRVFHTEWSGSRETSPAHLARCREHRVHHRGWWYAERPDGAVPEDVVRLMNRLGAQSPIPPLWRRRLVRTWAWLRLQRWIPDRVAGALDRRFERVLPLVALPLLVADLLRQLAASMTTKPRPAMSLTNAATSRSHVERSTA
ncbi:MAG TPA: N-acetylglucosaminyltransferase [Thermoanaerobaculia bacterium]|jgi:beta-1,4-mannosyl-glycoprotein beta-1,4-N-acetylglucosaminyltransferase